MEKNVKRYTYTDLANDVINLLDALDGEIEMDEAHAEAMRNKAIDLLRTQENKAQYNATHKKPSAKGASAETKAKAEAVAKVLTSVPQTTAEINEKLNTSYNPLQIANAVKYVPNVKTSKVIRTMTNSKGLKCEKEYTAYSI